MTDTDKLATELAKRLSGYQDPLSTRERPRRSACRCNCHRFTWQGHCTYCGCGDESTAEVRR